MDVKRDAISRAQRMFAVRDDLHVLEMLFEQRAQTGTSEKVQVTGLEQMPGDSFPVMEVGKHFQVGHGKQGASANNTRNFAKETIGLSDVFQHLNADGMIEFTVGARERGVGAGQSSMGQFALFEQFETTVV